MNIFDIITARVNQFIPKCAVDLRWDENALSYLHPTRGWKRLSYRRMGIHQFVTGEVWAKLLTHKN